VFHSQSSSLGVRGTARFLDPRKARVRDSSQPCFSFLENRNLVFRNQEKTSGTLYSVFKEPDPGTAFPPADDAVLPAPTQKLSAQRRTISIAKADPLRQEIFAPSRAVERRRGPRGEISKRAGKPLRGYEI